MNPKQLAPARRWEEVVIGASPVLAADSAAFNQVMSKLYYQYLPAAFRAHTPATDLRVWSALDAYLTTPATSRKQFVLSVQEATAVVQSVRELTEMLRRKS